MLPRRISIFALTAALAPFSSASAAESAAPTPPSPSPTPAATASPTPPTYVRFIDADLLLGERVANSYSPNRTGPVTGGLRAAAEYRFFGRNFAELDYRRWCVDHPSGFVTQPLTGAQTFVPGQRFTEADVAFNSSLYGVGHTYLATSTVIHSTSENLPTLHSDFGIGVERLPDPTQAASLFGSYYYYPELTGKLAANGGSRPNLRYKLQRFELGGALAVPHTAVFLSAGFVADHYLRKEHAPGDATHTAATLGIGYRL